MRPLSHLRGVCARSELQSCLSFATPQTKARQLLCPRDSPGKNTGVGCPPSSRASPQPRDQTGVSYIACTVGGLFNHWATLKMWSIDCNLKCEQECVCVCKGSTGKKSKLWVNFWTLSMKSGAVWLGVEGEDCEPYSSHTHTKITTVYRATVGDSDGKQSACNIEDVALIPRLGRSPEKEMTTHSSVLAWRAPWTEEPGNLQSMASQGVRHDWTRLHYHYRATMFRTTWILAEAVFHK